MQPKQNGRTYVTCIFVHMRTREIDSAPPRGIAVAMFVLMATLGVVLYFDIKARLLSMETVSYCAELRSFRRGCMALGSSEDNVWKQLSTT